MHTKVPLIALVKVFLKLGFIGFGGPAAHIAMMREEVVLKRSWMSEEQFLDLLGATNLIPGPNSTEMAIHIGYEKAGWKGLILSGICFILPAVLLTSLLAVLYKEYGKLPEVQPFIFGIKPVILPIILGAIFPLAKRSIKSTSLAIIGIIVFFASLLGINEIILMFGAGLAAFLMFYLRSSINNKFHTLSPLPLLTLVQLKYWSSLKTELFLTFLKIGAILYGSGYVLFAFLETELVTKGLLTHQELIDAIAVGQFTPGPVFSSVTFIGFQIDDFGGAVVSTIGIFLPSFLLVALLNPILKTLRNSVGFSIFLDAVNVASVALIASVCITMGTETFLDWKTILISLVSGLLIFKFKKLNSIFIILGGALFGYLLY